MRTVFGAHRGVDVMLTLGTTGWITGMSYMLIGPCVCGVQAILLEGSFAYPDPLRFARAALEHKVTLFKTGSALLRQLMVSEMRVPGRRR